MRPAWTTSRWGGLWLLAAGAAGCAAVSIPLPLTPAQLAGSGEGEALAVYLGQPDASPGVCDPRSPGPHPGAPDAGARRALARAFGEGRIEP
jgi:hypothetical protein